MADVPPAPLPPEGPDVPESLIGREQQQPTLFPLPDAEAAQRQLEAEGHFTGERLFKQRLEVYKAIVDALAEGLSCRAIARAFRVSTNTVKAVREREGLPIETQKKAVIANLNNFVEMASDRLVEEVDKIPPQNLSLSMAVAIDKMQLLEGNATARIEHVTQKSSMDDFNALVAHLPATVDLPASAVQVVGTGSATEGNLHKGAALELEAKAVSAGQVVPPAALPAEAIAAQRDSASLVCPAMSATDTDSDSERGHSASAPGAGPGAGTQARAAGAEQAGQGGGGGLEVAGGGLPLPVQEPQKILSNEPPSPREGDDPSRTMRATPSTGPSVPASVPDAAPGSQTPSPAPDGHS